ncbi:hypothetical protein [Aquisphaera insulae]|uniref:hypothetical protein n=1 Tax=Aquisphaera insulae TaxID=2712864 RepID=UPI0013EB4A22|nr:hypothetical protein [Aquisphaera insulae]
MADITAVYSLGPAGVSGDILSFDVNLNFAPSGTESSYELGSSAWTSRPAAAP